MGIEDTEKEKGHRNSLYEQEKNHARDLRSRLVKFIMFAKQRIISEGYGHQDYNLIDCICSSYKWSKEGRAFEVR